MSLLELCRPQGDAHMDEHGDPGISLVQCGVTACLTELISFFSQKNPFPFLPLSNLLHPLWHVSGRVLGSAENNVRDQSWLWGKCGVFFLLPCVIFQLDQFPRLAHRHAVRAGMCQEGFSLVLAQDKVWRDAGMSRTSHTVEQDPSSPHLGPGGWSSLW